MRTKLSAGAALLICAGIYADQLPMEPVHNAGQSITGAFEGWFQNADGTYSLLVGYYNRNLKQDVDVPIGPNNRIDPGGPDRGQPTHFLPNRQWGVFTITVPKDFGTGKLTWTIAANGTPTTVPISLNPLWELSPMVDATGNTPPYLRFEEKGPFQQGPRATPIKREASVSAPLALTVWVADDAKLPPGAPQIKLAPVFVGWSKQRGPGAVTFAPERPPVEKTDFAAPSNAVFTGKATTTATFSEPGEYWLRVVANDWSGDGGRGFQCCWTNGLIQVSVR